jgi:hypothetical protein
MPLTKRQQFAMCASRNCILQINTIEPTGEYPKAFRTPDVSEVFAILWRCKMLFPVNDYMLYVIKKETVQRYRREVEIDYLLNEINSQKPNRLERLARKTFHNLGYLLVALGRRLDRIELRSV